MLNYNQVNKESKTSLLSPSYNKREEYSQWKVLIFDEETSKSVALLLKVNDLREQGITLHLPLNSKRMPIKDVPAIYFLSPNKENIERLLEDLSNSLYDSYYINFSSTLPRPLLEYLAESAVKLGVSEQIHQVYDQYLNYQCYSSNLFSLNIKSSYSILNNIKTEDIKIENCINEISLGLLSILVTKNQIPIIKATKGNAAEMVAKKLDGKLRDLLRAPSSSILNNDTLFDSNSKNRPVLIIIDRNMDLIPMISHSWNYQPLIHDLLNIEQNQIKFEIEEEGRKVYKVYDIDNKDFFWNKNSNLPLPEIAKEISEELENYRKEADEITKLSKDTNINPEFDFKNNTLHLKSAINALPELTAKKNILDHHMNIASELFKKIESRQYDKLFQIEESILKENKQTILSIIQDDTILFEDKLRLFLYFYLSHPTLNQSDLQLLENELKKFNENNELQAFEAVKKIQQVSKMSTLSAGNAKTLTSNSSDLLDKFNFLGSQLKGGAYDKLINKVKNFLPVEHELAITKLVQNILELPNNNQNTISELIHLDPKSKIIGNQSNNNNLNFNSSQPINQVILFVIGGGSYNEFLNLKLFLEKQNNLEAIIYGSTEILSPNQFLNQLSQI
ncbi:snare binding protein Sly1 [Neoconidiobolus thromboides FSU 785]|nr:snare binding protein Sly1 [Neoconidiobolus thromboides FSU 785]